MVFLYVVTEVHGNAYRKGVACCRNSVFGPAMATVVNVWCDVRLKWQGSEQEHVMLSRSARY